MRKITNIVNTTILPEKTLLLEPGPNIVFLSDKQSKVCKIQELKSN